MNRVMKVNALIGTLLFVSIVLLKFYFLQQLGY